MSEPTNNQSGPRDVESVLADRYWLTPAGYAVLEQIEKGGDDE